MQYYISNCRICNTSIYWLGPNNFIVKNIYPTCIKCNYKTCEQDKKIDSSSIMAIEFLNKLFSIL